MNWINININIINNSIYHIQNKCIPKQKAVTIIKSVRNKVNLRRKEIQEINMNKRIDKKHNLIKRRHINNYKYLNNQVKILKNMKIRIVNTPKAVILTLKRRYIIIKKVKE